jgi:hypothetical protein
MQQLVRMLALQQGFQQKLVQQLLLVRQMQLD